MRKKFLVSILAVSMTAATLAGCGSQDGADATTATIAETTTAGDSTTNGENGTGGETTTAEETTAAAEDGTTAVEETTTADPTPIADESKLKKLADYKGLEVTKSTASVTDDTVDTYITNLATQYATTEEIKEGTVANGDTVNIDYVGKVDGKEFEGGSANGSDLEIGSNSFIEGFESGLEGKKIGDTVDLKLKFPDDYNSTNLAGKDVVFTVKINYVKKTTNATVDDALVKDKLSYTGSTTLDEYKTWLKDYLKVTQIYQSVWSTYIADCEMASYSEADIKDAKKSVEKQFEQSLKQQYGVDLDYYKEQTGITDDQWQEQLETAAKSSIKARMALEEIAKKEDIEVTDEEYDEKIDALAKMFGYDTTGEFEESYGKDEARLYMLNEAVARVIAKDVKIVADPETTTAAEAATEGEAATTTAAEETTTAE